MDSHRHSDWDPRSQCVLDDHIAAYDGLRRRCPVAYSEYLGWSLLRYADVMRVLLDHSSFSSAVSGHLSVPNGMDPPAHTAFRRIIAISSRFQRKEVLALGRPRAHVHARLRFHYPARRWVQ